MASQHTSAALIRAISDLSGSSAPVIDGDALAHLQAATRDLIDVFKAEGRLRDNPMELALTRSVDLHEEAADRRLRGKRVLITGGSGCVGTRLREIIAGFDPAAIVTLDVVAPSGAGTWCEADIRDPAAIDRAFAQERPEVVFHLASVREPGKAELVVCEAVDTNVFGTGYMIEACRRHGVDQAVYSSTGKCYAYLSDHVYTASKKLAEAQWISAARKGGHTQFAMTRFTHVLENGIVTRDIHEGIDQSIVGLHGPDRHFNIQNLRQATHLLINALALAGEQAPDIFWSAIDLGWPVNTLELALFEIVKSGKPAGVRFLGVPKGYDETFFRGNFDWSGLHEYHPLVNALETPSLFSDASGTMIGAHVPECPDATLQAALDALRAVLDAPVGSQTVTDDSGVKQALIKAVAQVTTGMFAETKVQTLVDILWWGSAAQWVKPGAGLVRFSALMGILADTIVGKLADQPVLPGSPMQHQLADIAATFDAMPTLKGRLDGVIVSQQLQKTA